MIITKINKYYLSKIMKNKKKNRYLRLYHWLDTSAGGILVSVSISRPVVSALAHTRFI
jgi:hypothetical protein